MTITAQGFRLDAALRASVAAIEQGIRPIDILFNNARTTQRAPFHEFPHGARQRILRINVDRMFIADAAFNQWLVNCAPRRRWGDVEDLGGAAAFVYRHIFYVDGGVTATL